MTKIVKFTKNDLILGVCYSAGEIAGFEDRIADNLIKREFAELHGDGRPVKVGGRLPLQRGDFGFEEPKGGKAA
jgi:hypothetical protein